ncbi:MAG TPA: hypothetical protein VKT49_15515 [Bryobacteraceae bacterium]|nr:hypothetical protein [Bryobacteraceae bacterium]
MQKIRDVALLALASMAAFAQAPTVTAVLDAGGYTSNLAPGSVFVVKGSNLCSTSVSVTGTPYSTAAMGGAAIRLTPAAGGSPLDAYMVYCYNSGGVTQLAAVIPSSAAPGTYNLTVTANGTAGAAFATTVVARNFQLMTQPATGSGRALAQNVVSQTQYDVNGFTTQPVPGQPFQRSPAKASQVMIAWGTGLGAAAGFDATAPPGLDFLAQGLDVKVIVGGMSITPSFAGRSNTWPGLDNIGFTLPANVPTGCNVPLQVSVAGQMSNLTTISIASNGSACSDSQFAPAVLSKLDSGGSITAGYFNLTGFNTNLAFQGQNLAVRIEGASGAFAKYTADTITQLPNVSTTGGCEVFQTTTTGSAGSGVSNSLTFLDAGAISLNGPNVSSKALTESRNVYTLNLGTSMTGSGTPPIPGLNPSPLITSGTYTLNGAGGADVGPFTASVTINQPLTVTGGLPATVNRSQDLTIAWTGGNSSDAVVIAGTSSILTTGTVQSGTFNTATFVCTTTAGRQTFTVPSSILQQLQPTTGGTSIGVLTVSSTSSPAAGNGLFTAPLKAGGNTDFALFTAGIGTAATPTYQ